MAKKKAVQHLSIENRIAVVREYAALWQQFFTYFSDDLIEKNITQEEEHEFGNLVSILALNHFKFQELSIDYFKDAPKILNVLTETVSLSHMKAQPEATFSKIQIEWHTLFIGMNKALGKLLSELPPKRLAEVQAEQQGGQSPEG
ncbi:hypothetical protein KQI84_12695 [bacterium]|nr:hypothetical protein [bacterium]